MLAQWHVTRSEKIHCENTRDRSTRPASIAYSYQNAVESVRFMIRFRQQFGTTMAHSERILTKYSGIMKFLLSLKHVPLTYHRSLILCRFTHNSPKLTKNRKERNTVKGGFRDKRQKESGSQEHLESHPRERIFGEWFGL